MRGTIGIEGFFSADAVFDDLQRLGYTRVAVDNACQWLLVKRLIEADNMDTKELLPGASVRISSSGFIHLRILSERLEYVSACLYETPYLSKDIAEYVGQMFSDSLATNGLSISRKGNGVQEFQKYLRELKSKREGYGPNIVGLPTAAEYLISHMDACVSEAFRPRGERKTVQDALDV